MQSAIRIVGTICALSALACFSGCSSYNSSSTVTLEGLDNPTIKPWNGGEVIVQGTNGAKPISSAGQEVDVNSKLTLKGGMLVTAGTGNVSVRVGSGLVVQIPPLCTVFITHDGEVLLDGLIPRQIHVTGARLVTVKLAGSAITNQCKRVIGKGAARIYAKNCSLVTVNDFAGATAIDCSEVRCDDNSTVSASKCANVSANGSSSLKAEDCQHVVGRGRSAVKFQRCGVVETFDEATQENIATK